MLDGNKVEDHEEVISDTEEYLEAKDESFCKNSIEKL